MANERNLKFFTSNQDREAASRNGKKGAIASAASKRRKANMRKIAQAILDGKYFDKQKNKWLTGEEIVESGLLANIMDPNNKNWGKAMDLMVQLTDAAMNAEQKAKLKAETQLAKAKARAADPTKKTSTVKDNFIEALNAMAAKGWEEEDETDNDDDV